jgi:YHS domain-containing protein
MSAQLGNILYFLLLAGLFVFMMRFGCGAPRIMGHGHHQGAKSADDQANDRNLRLVPPDQTVDPVCGMTVQTAGAKSAVHNGRVYYFCSQDCREKFENNPASYVKAAAA